MSTVVDGLRYSKEHEWIKVDGNIAYVGVTDFAQDAMGDLVYVDCGTNGSSVSVGDAVAVLESVKAASDVYAPLSGTIVETNDILADTPEAINANAFDNFLFAIEMSDPSELDQLMDAEDYKAFCQQ